MKATCVAGLGMTLQRMYTEWIGGETEAKGSCNTVLNRLMAEKKNGRKINVKKIF